MSHYKFKEHLEYKIDYLQDINEWFEIWQNE